ncbi:IS110 family RNA-guided transposase [Plantactinospora endophytica]|uniref:IS110 family transposase n=2 Tax=Plantactinospora endophytica TaxID=673535 RepID=UPI0036251022
MVSLWAGVDVGKTHHHICVIDDDATVALSERLPNDEHTISNLLDRLAERQEPIRWAVDMLTGPVELLLAVLHDRGADIRYINSTIASRMAEAFHGERKTDALDAYVLAQTLRMRDDLPAITVGEADVKRQQLRLLVARRLGLVEDRLRIINRIQHLLTTISPTLAKVINLERKGHLRLLARWPSPSGLRHAGEDEISAYLRQHKVLRAKALTEKVLTAAHAQTVSVPGEGTAAAILAQMALDLETTNARITEIEGTIGEIVAAHELGGIITSLPGIGTTLAAEFLAYAGIYRSPAALAAHAGLAPVTRDSGKQQGHLVSPTRYHRGLRRVFSLSTFAALTCCPDSRAYYDRKKAEGKTHRQASAALSRRRVNVLWACIRDKTPYQPRPPRPGSEDSRSNKPDVTNAAVSGSAPFMS